MKCLGVFLLSKSSQKEIFGSFLLSKSSQKEMLATL